MGVQISLRDPAFNSFGHMFTIQKCNCWVIWYFWFSFLRNILFSTILTLIAQEFQLFHIFANIVIYCFFKKNISHSKGMRWYRTVALIYVSLMTVIFSIFSCACLLFVYFLCRNTCSIFWPFVNEFVPSLLSFRWFLYILDPNSSSDI